ncbi:alpha/beta hydrolase [Paenibacillus puerhi]|uniref:alpha/beta hydrolase n=1 Tax=Paenibacillus puerhi TaxID=2692622 RepID=UPI001357F2B1|nr:alpha/beta hydrolase [Paenibacillus puerhi]
MLIESFRLREDDDNVKLHAYILDASQEYGAGKRRPAVIVCPGGGYVWTSDREAEPVAMRYAALGYHTFVLRYSTQYPSAPQRGGELPPGNDRSRYPGPLLDLAKAIQTVRQHADRWQLDADKVAVCGFSAGGHLAASLGVHWHAPWLAQKLGTEARLLKPNAIVLGYAVLDYLVMKGGEQELQAFRALANQAVFGNPDPSHEERKALSPVEFVSPATPPAFVWHTANDALVPAANSLRFAAALAEHGVPYELHVFEDGAHGLSLCDETTAAGPEHLSPECRVWFDMSVNWLRKRFAT